MTRLDQLARPIRRNGEHISAIVERERKMHFEGTHTGGGGHGHSNNGEQMVLRRRRQRADSCRDDDIDDDDVDYDLDHHHNNAPVKRMSRSMIHLASNNNHSNSNNNNNIGNAIRAMRKTWKPKSAITGGRHLKAAKSTTSLAQKGVANRNANNESVNANRARFSPAGW